MKYLILLLLAASCYAGNKQVYKDKEMEILTTCVNGAEYIIVKGALYDGGTVAITDAHRKCDY